MTIIAKTPRWLPLAVVGLVVYGLVTVALQWRKPHPPAAPTPVDVASLDTAYTDGVVTEALGQIPVDSVAIKNGWRDDVGGIDLASFTPKQREIMVRAANSQRCTCGCGFTLAACRAYDLTCPVSLPRVEALADSVRRGLIASAHGLRTRPDALVRP
jgi:hypothetical protein